RAVAPVRRGRPRRRPRRRPAQPGPARRCPRAPRFGTARTRAPVAGRPDRPAPAARWRPTATPAAAGCPRRGSVATTATPGTGPPPATGPRSRRSAAADAARRTARSRRPGPIRIQGGTVSWGGDPAVPARLTNAKSPRGGSCSQGRTDGREARDYLQLEGRYL